jgi:hypothetical protein
MTFLAIPDHYRELVLVLLLWCLSGLTLVSRLAVLRLLPMLFPLLLSLPLLRMPLLRTALGPSGSLGAAQLEVSPPDRRGFCLVTFLGLLGLRQVLWLEWCLPRSRGG